LERLDRAVQRRITRFLKERIATSENPRRLGKALSGRLRPQGPASIWIVDVYILAHDSREPVAEATVNGRGEYEAKDLPAGKYVLRPVWDSDPREAEVACVTDKNHTAPTFRITGRPLID
jgi:hypothetical protein